MKVLVTGGSGFIGSRVVSHYQGRAEVAVLDNLRTGRLANLQGLECECFESSILDSAMVDRVIDGVDIVNHLDTLISVPESDKQTGLIFAIDLTPLVRDDSITLEELTLGRIGEFAIEVRSAVQAASAHS